MPVVLTSAQTRFLRGQAHDLKALLQIGGKGVTPAFIAELVEQTGAALVQRIGHTAVLYRPSKERRQIVLPRA